MTSKTINPPKLSDAEWVVMRPFWEKGPLAARDVFSSVEEENNWSYQTVKTMLSRLVKKGALEYTQVGNSYLYKPKYSKDELTGDAVKNFTNLVLDGSLSSFILNFFSGRKPEKNEIDEIRNFIDKAENGNTNDNTKNSIRNNKKKGK